MTQPVLAGSETDIRRETPHLLDRDRTIDFAIYLSSRQDGDPCLEGVDKNGDRIFSFLFSRTGDRVTHFLQTWGYTETGSVVLEPQSSKLRLQGRILLAGHTIDLYLEGWEILHQAELAGDVETLSVEAFDGCRVIGDRTRRRLNRIGGNSRSMAAVAATNRVEEGDQKGHSAPDCCKTGARLLQETFKFAATCQFPRAIPVLIGEGPHAGQLAAAMNDLFPDSTVYRIEATGSAQAVEGRADRGAEDGFVFLSESAVAETLGDGEAVLAGERIVESGLHQRLRSGPARLHLLSLESTVKPVGEIDLDGRLALGNAFVAVDGPEDWCFRKYDKGVIKPSRQGLDIVVAMYNARDYIVRCIDSLLVDGRPEIRVIVVNDGSTDASDELVEEHFRDDPRVRLVSKLNGGCASARNYGRMVSDTSHIAFVDADDFVDETFFAALFDLAAYCGDEVVQGGFDLYDEADSRPYSPSYEEALFEEVPRRPFGACQAIEVDNMRLLSGQPSIWRRVYRRDFLDSKKLFFPENIRAFDDYIFHLLTLTYSGNLHMLPDLRYHYRQHPDQDVKQADSRHFSVLYMFRQLITRSIDEGWNDFSPYVASILNSIAFTVEILKGDLLRRFLDGSARTCALIRQIYGDGVISEQRLSLVEHPDFLPLYREAVMQLSQFPQGPHWTFLNAPEHHPDLVKLTQRLDDVRS